MPRLSLEIDQITLDSLAKLAAEFRRTPRMQAEWMLIEIVREAMAAYRSTSQGGIDEVCGP